MTREWKPGEVAVVDSWRGSGQLAFRCERILGQPTWCVLDETDTRGLDDHEVTDARPVVWIDPGSCEQVERLAAAYHESAYIAPWSELHIDTRTAISDGVQAALWSLVEPPKPHEPTGLGAQVVDHDGETWVRNSTGAWINLHGSYGTDPALRWDVLVEKYGPLEVQP